MCCKGPNQVFVAFLFPRGGGVQRFARERCANTHKTGSHKTRGSVAVRAGGRVSTMGDKSDRPSFANGRATTCAGSNEGWRKMRERVRSNRRLGACQPASLPALVACACSCLLSREA